MRLNPRIQEVKWEKQLSLWWWRHAKRWSRWLGLALEWNKAFLKKMLLVLYPSEETLAQKRVCGQNAESLGGLWQERWDSGVCVHRVTESMRGHSVRPEGRGSKLECKGHAGRWGLDLICRQCGSPERVLSREAVFRKTWLYGRRTWGRQNEVRTPLRRPLPQERDDEIEQGNNSKDGEKGEGLESTRSWK